MADDATLIAHLLRRLTFGPHPGQIDELLPLGVAGALEQLLAASPLEPDEPQLGSGDDYGVVRNWWLRVLSRPDAGLHERMVWFWHGHLTSSLQKCTPGLMLVQHRVLRQHALGNLRDLLQAITVDGAMLEWLDGAYSSAEAPNENYARELMELFALGIGSYTEADVRAGSIAFSGWGIDYENGLTVYFDEGSGPQAPVEFLGTTVSSAAEAVDAVCDHPACAPFVAGRIYRYLMGTEAEPARREELGALLRDSGLEIRALVEAIVRDPAFLESRSNRPRTGLEWFLAAQALLGVELDAWRLDNLGQTPFLPPNVAGWPGDERWVSAGAVFSKAWTAWDSSGDAPTFDSDDPVSEILAKAGLYEVSAESRAALDDAASSVEGRRETSSLLHALTLMSPEFGLA